MPLDRTGQQRHRPLPSGGAQQAWSVYTVEAREVCRVGHLFERVQARLAGLNLHQVQDFVLPREQAIVEPEQDPAASARPGRRPRRLCAAGAARQVRHVRRRGGREHRDPRTRERRVYGHRLRRCGRPLAEQGEQRIDACRLALCAQLPGLQRPLR